MYYVFSMTYLRRVNNGGEILDTKHSEIWYCNSSTLEFVWLKFIISGLFSQSIYVGTDVLQSLSKKQKKTKSIASHIEKM